MKKVAVIISDGFEEIETINVIDILRRAGIKVEVLGLNSTTLTGAHDIAILGDEVFDYYNSLEYDGIIFTGGMKNAIDLSQNDNVMKLLGEYNNAGKLISAICASPAIVLEKSGVLANKSATCYPSMELIGNLKSCEYVDKSVVVCDNIITSQSPYTAFAFALSIAKYLGYDVSSLQDELKGSK